MLRKVEDGTPTWLPIPQIDSEKEAARLLRKSANSTGKDDKNKGSLPIDKILKERGYIEITLHRLRAGYLCVDVQIEGKKLFLAVDTAAPSTHLDSQRVNHLSLKWQHWNQEEGKEKAGPKRAGDYCEITKLEIGRLTLGNLLIGSHDLSDINKPLKFYLDPPIDGVLGSDILTKLNTIIDYSTFKLYVCSKDSRENGNSRR
ncbi:MAG TPA: aspartyl protease family protein [Gemmataceae bacterium]|nr:aspartyl protease family protein [Gemmataceae bacterium]